MYTATIKDAATGDSIMAFSSNNRNRMRVLTLLCHENDFDCETTIEVAAKVVNFKNLAPTLAVQAKVDAVADMKESAKGK